MADCLAKGANMWDRWRVSGGVLNFLRCRLVPEMPAVQEVWEAARMAHYAAMVDIFGADSAEVSAALHHTLISPFAFPVSSPVLPLHLTPWSQSRLVRSGFCLIAP